MKFSREKIQTSGGPWFRKQRPLSSFLPNVLTLCGMCCGITGIHMALNHHSSFAIVSILLAVFFDGIDGKVARKLGAVSRFGAELDSLSDFATFGIAPSVIVYIFSLSAFNNIGWTFALLFAMSMALRLARFNTCSIEGTFKPWMSCFGVGVPAPFGAYMLLWPLMIEKLIHVPCPGILYVIWTLTVSALSISRIPTFLLKFPKQTLSQQKAAILLLGIVFAIGTAYSYPWFVAVVIGLGYLVSIPFSIHFCKKAEKNYKTVEKPVPASSSLP